MDRTNDWIEKLDKFLVGRGWVSRLCASCGRVFYAKERNEAMVCQRGKCSHDPLDFLLLSKRRIPLPVSAVAQRLEELFTERGYKKREAVCVTETLGETDLIGAGVQVLEPVLFGKETPTSGAAFILQPVTRMQYFGSSGEEGNSTAFVNVCSEDINLTFERHLEHIDMWLGALSRLGIFMGDITLLRRISDEDWGNGPFKQFELFVVYGGLELGDASYGFIPTREQGIVPVSDVGFGLERIVWSLNKFHSYFDSLRPITSGLLLSRHAHDALRTAMLFTLCGISAANEGVGFQLRKVCKYLLKEGVRGWEVDEVLHHYLDFWNDFLGGGRNIDEARQAFHIEMERLVQDKIRAMLKMPRAQLETTEAYANRLVYTQGVPIENIRRALIKKT